MANTNPELLQCIKDYQCKGISAEQWKFIYDFIERVGKSYKIKYPELWDDMKGDAMVYIMDKSMYNCELNLGEKYCYQFMRKSIVGVFKKVLGKQDLQSTYINNNDEYTQLYTKSNKALEDVYNKADELGECVIHNNVLANIYKGISKADYIIINRQGDVDKFLGDRKCVNGYKIKRTWYFNKEKVNKGDVLVCVFGKSVRCYIYSQEELERTRNNLLEADLTDDKSNIGV